MDKNRFKQLLESTMGNVKPLITEEENTINSIPPLNNLPDEIKTNTKDVFYGNVVNDWVYEKVCL